MMASSKLTGIIMVLQLSLSTAFVISKCQFPTASIASRSCASSTFKKSRPITRLYGQGNPAKPLETIVRLRGEVDSGYGRGGKKLGFPTANLPASLFQEAMKNVPSGVYFGWAWIEGTDTGRGVPHKAAVNVGYSPTFEGQENPEKIVEAHLILDSPITDFYSEIMRLSLIGFLRNEKKFDSFPELVQAITADVNNAKQALDKKPFKSFKKDGKFMSDDDWVGKSGGNTNASWEFEPVMDQSTTTEKA